MALMCNAQGMAPLIHIERVPQTKDSISRITTAIVKGSNFMAAADFAGTWGWTSLETKLLGISLESYRVTCSEYSHSVIRTA